MKPKMRCQYDDDVALYELLRDRSFERDRSGMVTRTAVLDVDDEGDCHDVADPIGWCLS